MSDSGSQSPEPDEEEYDYESLPQQYKDVMNHSLRSSCVSGYDMWVNKLITKGADVNAYVPSDTSKLTALHVAVLNFRGSLVELLVPKANDENKQRAIAITTERLQSLMHINHLLGGAKPEISLEPAAEKAPSTSEPVNVDARIEELKKANEATKRSLEEHMKAAHNKEAEAKAGVEAITKELEAERASRKAVDAKLHELSAELKEKSTQIEKLDEKLQASAKERQTLKNKIRLAAVQTQKTPGTPQPPQFASHPNFTFRDDTKISRSVSMIVSAPSTPANSANKSPRMSTPTKRETKDDMDLEEPVKSRVRRLVTRWESIKEEEVIAAVVPATVSPRG